MILQAIVSVPHDMEPLPEQRRETLRTTQIECPKEWMVGVQPVNNRRLVLVSLRGPDRNPLEGLRKLFTDHAMDWELIGLAQAHGREVYVNPWPAIVPYLLDVWEYDKDGQQIPDSNVPQTRIPHAWGGYSTFPLSG